MPVSHFEIKRNLRLFFLFARRLKSTVKILARPLSNVSILLITSNMANIMSGNIIQAGNEFIKKVNTAIDGFFIVPATRIPKAPAKNITPKTTTPLNRKPFFIIVMFFAVYTRCQ